MPTEPESGVRSYYGADYRASIANILTPERTAAEVAFLLEATGLTPPASVLDLGCGHGRHTLEFARRGYTAVGVDLNADSIALAESARPQGLAATFVVGDYASPPPGAFDLVMSLFGSFGFGTDEENARVLREWCRRVREGGWLALELWHRELIVAEFEPRRRWRASPDLEVDERRSFDPIRGRVDVHYEYTFGDGTRTEHDLSVRLYTAAELRGLLAREGLEVTTLFGSSRGEPYSPRSRALVVLARRGASS